MQVIGVDAGGTFTDTVVVRDDGTTTVGKALSVPSAPEQGVLDSMAVAAASLGTDLEGLLGQTDVFAHGTTVGLNALLTGRGARVGLLSTAGFESTLAMARSNKVHGLLPDELTTPTAWAKPPLLVPRQHVRGIRGRIDAFGHELEPLDLDQARRAIDELLALDVEAIAIALLWSTADPTHERAVADLVRAMAPGLHVSVSSDVAARIGEYERTATVVVDAYVGPLVSSYLERLEARLVERGFAGRFFVMRMAGGVQPVEAARAMPVTTLHSGPIGGVSAAQEMGAQVGHPNIVTADVGGTSFDVGIVIDGSVRYAARPTIERQPLAVPVVDVTSIGIGGGSIAWIDGELGVLRVGPASAAADPGPACYGRGGERPTLTDAAVVLGYVARLGEALVLDADAARRAIDRDVAAPLGLSVEQAAEGILDVASEHMRGLVRRTTIERGHDPSDFALYVFGGAGGQYVGRFAAELGVQEIVVPRLAAELSAYGAATCDLRAGADRDVVPGPLDARLDSINGALVDLEALAAAQLEGAGRSQAHGDLEVSRSVGLRFIRQRTRIDIPLPGPVVAPSDIDGLVAAFHQRYEEIVGKGTARTETPVEVVTASVSVVAATRLGRAHDAGPAVDAAPTQRQAVFGGAPTDTPVHDWDALTPEQVIVGPGIVESPRTTLIVQPGQEARVDEGGNMRMRTP